MKTIETWLPVFSGFYNTIWSSNSDEEIELYNINETREEKGLAPIEWNDIEFDYKTREENVVEQITDYLKDIFKKMNLVSDMKFQKIVSPRQYNFRNDSANIEIDLSEENEKNIMDYIKNNESEFEDYIRDRFSSYDGFSSFYTNDAEQWLEEDENVLEHEHKLGCILEFIIQNEYDMTELEMDMLNDIETYIDVLNYDELMMEKK